MIKPTYPDPMAELREKGRQAGGQEASRRLCLRHIIKLTSCMRFVVKVGVSIKALYIYIALTTSNCTFYLYFPPLVRLFKFSTNWDVYFLHPTCVTFLSSHFITFNKSLRLTISRMFNVLFVNFVLWYMFIVLNIWTKRDSFFVPKERIPTLLNASFLSVCFLKHESWWE